MYSILFEFGDWFLFPKIDFSVTKKNNGGDCRRC